MPNSEPMYKENLKILNDLANTMIKTPFFGMIIGFENPISKTQFIIN